MADGDRWAVSPVGGGLIIELDGQTVCMATDQRHARYLVSVANAWERQQDGYRGGPLKPAGDRLDAERRGETVRCAHAGIHYFDDEIGRSRCARCEAVVGPDRGQEQADMPRENGSV